MSQTDTKPTTYGWTGWHDGETECEPPEPGKAWLSIGPVEDDGSVSEELAIIVSRSTDPRIRATKERDAKAIVRALNLAFSDDELAYIRTALDFQLDHDDDSVPPHKAHGESAYDKILREGV